MTVHRPPEFSGPSFSILAAGVRIAARALHRSGRDFPDACPPDRVSGCYSVQPCRWVDVGYPAASFAPTKRQGKRTVVVPSLRPRCQCVLACKNAWPAWNSWRDRHGELDGHVPSRVEVGLNWMCHPLSDRSRRYRHHVRRDDRVRKWKDSKARGSPAAVFVSVDTQVIVTSPV